MLNQIYQRAKRALNSGPVHPRKLSSWSDIEKHAHNIQFDHSVEGIEGWLTPGEKHTLYALGYLAPGPMLEIGSWVGLSTSCLANGIKDSKRKIRFVACEFNPTLEHFKPVPGGIGFFLKPDVYAGLCSEEAYRKGILPIISLPGGVLGQLKKNLADRNLADLVAISVGNFKELKPEPFGFVFCDAMHDPGEIELNASFLKGFLTNGSILACHDSNPVNEKSLRQFFKFKHAFTVDSLFVGEVIM